MLALWWNTLPGSYSPLIRASRSYLAEPKARRSEVVLELHVLVEVALAADGVRAQRLPGLPDPGPVRGQHALVGCEADEERSEPR